jgi:hypothetical protein
MRTVLSFALLSVPLAAGPIVAGNGTVSIGEYAFNQNQAGGTTFQNGELTVVGNGLGNVGAAGAVNPQNQGNPVNFNGNFPGTISGCAVQGGNGGGCTGIANNSFGAGSSTIYSGNYFVGMYFTLADPTAADGGASIIYDSATATFTNNSTLPVTGYAGAFLGILGAFGGQNNAVVGASIDGTLNVNGTGNQAFAPVVLFASSQNGQPVEMQGGSWGYGYYNCAIPGLGFCNNFWAWGVSLINGGNQVTINANGGTLGVNGVLSVIADPMASIVFDLPSDPLLQIPGNVNLPNFGTLTATPEPGTWMLLLAGLALFTGIQRKRVR